MADGKVIVDIDADSSGFQKALGGLGSLASKALSGAGSAILSFVKDAVSAGNDFEQAMANVAATAGKTMDELRADVVEGVKVEGIEGLTEFTGNLEDFAQVLGSKTKFSATEAAEALNYMALAGYNTTQSVQMLPNVLNLAAAGAMDLAKASDMVTDVSSAFGLDVGTEEGMARITQMVDEMAKAASTGNTSVEQLGEAFLTVGGLAKELNGGTIIDSDGVSHAVDGVQELEIALTAMANSGIKGSEAGTHMRNVLTKLTSDADKFKEYGVDVFDETTGQMRSLKDIFSDLNDQMSHMDPGDRLAAMADLFNARELTTQAALLQAIGQDWDYIGDSILDAAGSAKKMAETQLDTLTGQITLFQSALEGVQIGLTKQLSPALKDFVKVAANGMGEVSDAFQSAFGENGGGIEELAQKLVNISKNVGRDFNAVVSDLVEQIKAALPSIKKILTGLSDSTRQFLTGLSKNLSELFTSAFSELVPTLAYTIPNMSKAFGSIFADIVGVIRDAIPVIVDTLQDLIPQLLAAWSTNLHKIGDLLPSIIEMLDGVIADIGEWLQTEAPSVIESIGNLLKDILPTLTTNLASGISTLITSIAAVLPDLISVFGDIVVQISEVLGEELPQLQHAVCDITRAIIAAFADNMDIIFDVGGQILDTIVNAILDNLDLLTSVATTIIYMIDGIFPSLINAISVIIVNIGKYIEDHADEIADLISDIVVQLADCIVCNVGYFSRAAATLIKNFATAISKALPSLISAGVEILTALIDVIVDNLPLIIDAGVQILDALLDCLTQPDTLQSLITGAIQIIEALANGLIKCIDPLVTAATQIVESLIDWLLEDDNLQMIVEGAVDIILALSQGLLQCSEQLIDAAFKIIDSLIDWLLADDNLQMIIDATVGIIEAVADGLIQHVEQLAQAAVDIITKLVEYFSNEENQEKLLDAASAILTAIGNGLVTLAADLWNFLGDVVGKIVEWFSDPQNIEGAKESGKAILEKIGAGLLMIGDRLHDWFASMLETMKNKLDEVDWHEIGKNIITFILDLPMNIWETCCNIKELYTNFKNSLHNKLAEIDWFGIGENILEGIFQGMINLAQLHSWIWGKIAEIGGGIVDGFKDYFGIASPSKLMAQEIGQFIPAGIAEGVADGTAAAERSIQSQINKLGNDLQVPQITDGGFDILDVAIDDTSVQNALQMLQARLNNSSVELDDITVTVDDTALRAALDEMANCIDVDDVNARLSGSVTAFVPPVNNVVQTVETVQNVSTDDTADGYGDLIIPVQIGGQNLETLVISAAQRANARSGGRTL